MEQNGIEKNPNSHIYSFKQNSSSVDIYDNITKKFKQLKALTHGVSGEEIDTENYFWLMSDLLDELSFLVEQLHIKTANDNLKSQ